jgi:aryl-alcohol dehydrogenase-like predicted oxidoreductase
MEQIEIPGLAARASRIALGTWAMGGWMWGGSDEGDAIRTIHAAFDQGINLIDTAPAYGFGRSEELIGKALAGGKRQRALIATKVGLEWRDGKVFRNSSPVRLRQELEASLRRLRTDVIDLYQVHWPDESVPLEETAAVLEGFRRDGKIRALGLSNFSPAQMDRFQIAAPLRTVQPPYNMFERQIEADVLPYAQRHDLAVLAYGALCRSLLTGRITETTTFAGDDLRNTDPKFTPPRLGQYLAAVQQLDAFARNWYGKTVLAVAVRWLLDRGNVVALWGARRPDQLTPMSEVMGWTLDIEGMREIDRILAATIKDPVGPEFMAPPPTPVGQRTASTKGTVTA